MVPGRCIDYAIWTLRADQGRRQLHHVDGHVCDLQEGREWKLEWGQHYSKACLSANGGLLRLSCSRMFEEQGINLTTPRFLPRIPESPKTSTPSTPMASTPSTCASPGSNGVRAAVDASEVRVPPPPPGWGGME